MCVCVLLHDSRTFDHGLPSRWQDNGKVGVNETRHMSNDTFFASY